MKMRWMGLSFAVFLVACGGGQEPETSADVKESPASAVVECEQASAAARDLIAQSESVSPATPDEFRTFYGSWRDAVAAWNADDHVCLQEGAQVMERLKAHQSTASEFEQADEAMQARLAPEFVARPNASDYFDTFFAGGVKPVATVRESAFNVAKAAHDADYKAFQAHGWGTTSEDGATTCVTSNDPFEPTGDVEPQMLKIFAGKTDVHVLCRLPVDASTFGGDDGGTLRIELHQGDWKGEPVTAVDLGKPEKWGKTRFFTARFAVPLSSTREAETYHVELVARRPAMGDERIVGTTFWWHR